MPCRYTPRRTVKRLSFNLQSVTELGAALSLACTARCAPWVRSLIAPPARWPFLRCRKDTNGAAPNFDNQLSRCLERRTVLRCNVSAVAATSSDRNGYEHVNPVKSADRILQGIPRWAFRGRSRDFRQKRRECRSSKPNRRRVALDRRCYCPNCVGSVPADAVLARSFVQPSRRGAS